MNQGGESGSTRFADDEQINRMLNQVVASVKGFCENQLDQVRRLTRVGTALSAERRLDRLMEMIVEEARKLANADGGSLYTVTDDESALRFAIVQNDSMRVRMGGSGAVITWPPVPLWGQDGKPNHANVCAFTYHTGMVLNCPDVYDVTGFAFHGPREFDANTGYRTRSMLVVPLRDHENVIIGVLQLLNARDGAAGDLIPFSPMSQEMTECLASLAAVALSNNRLIQDLQRLFQCFIRVIAAAVDEKSPYTGGHVRRMADLTMDIARKINEVSHGPYSDVHLSDDEMGELQIAAWLHDVGKVTTPEYVVDKATKLQTIYDRIEEVGARFEVLKRDVEIESLRKQLPGGVVSGEWLQEIRTLEDEFAFLSEVNLGSEFMDDEKIERLRSIARRTWNVNGLAQPLLREDEVHSLSVRRGTLTGEEREIVNNHVRVTLKMLSQLPFPRKMRNVPLYAAAHHERLDGSGYPQGLRSDHLPLQCRILALADVFEALTAADRPYRRANSISEAISILETMAEENLIDADLFELFVQEGIHLKYARQELGLAEGRLADQCGSIS